MSKSLPYVKLTDVMIKNKGEALSPSLSTSSFYEQIESRRSLRARKNGMSAPDLKKQKVEHKTDEDSAVEDEKDQGLKMELEANENCPMGNGVKTADEERKTDEDSAVESDEMQHENEVPYAELLKKRRSEHLEFLNSLGIGQMKKQLSSLISEIAAKSSSSQRRRRNISQAVGKPKRKNVQHVRRSLRLQNKPSENYSLDELFNKATTVYEYPKKKKIRGTLSFSVAAQETGDQLPDSFVSSLQFLSKEKRASRAVVPLSQYEKKFAKMKINDSLIAKLAYSRIYCITVHPSSTKLLFATGSRDGELSFWDVDQRQKDLPLLFTPHSERITCLEFSPYKLCEIYSSSFDGTMRCGNLTKGVFDEVFCATDSDDEDILCSSFDFLSSSTFLVGQRHGVVSVVDKRTKNIKGEKSHHVLECVLKTVSIHPVQKDYFVAAGGDGIASIWDLRHVKKPVARIPHGRTLNSAYFSPVTGNFILTTSMDDRVSIFDSSSLTANVKLKKAIRHDNHTGRWLAPFRAVWLPNCEEGFVVGSMQQPRRIEVYSSSGTLVHNFAGDSLMSVTSVNAFHPERLALGGANSSGKIHVFMGKEDS